MGPIMIEIIVNAKRYKRMIGGEMSYEDLATYFGFKDAKPTVVYSKGHPDNPEGSLLPGQVVYVADGMIFNVAHTGAA